MFVLIHVLFLCKCVFALLPSSPINNDFREDLHSLKSVTKLLSAELEKWNDLFLTSFEPRFVSTAVSLANIDKNVNNLQERAHVWDTFQLHIAAWNEQLATLDRKADIISKGQEQILAMESKFNLINHVEYKVDEILNKIHNIQEILQGVVVDIHQQRDLKNHNTLFEEFAGRGMLSSIKTLEKKLDRLLLSQQNALVLTKKGEEKAKLTVKCNTPRFMEEILNDISSKVDIIFDRITDKEENYSNEYDIEQFSEVKGSGDSEIPVELKLSNATKQIANEPNEAIEDVIERTLHIENITETILYHMKRLNNIDKFIKNCNANSSYYLQSIFNEIKTFDVNFNEKFDKIIESYFNEQRAHFESFLLKHVKVHNNCNIIPTTSTTATIPHREHVEHFETQKTGCEELSNERGDKSGVYIFGNITDSKNRTYNKKYCLLRDNGSWTVIQKRDNFDLLQNFNLSWVDYKHGFGNMKNDFWFGNDFVSKFSLEEELILRIELEDFNNNQVWAEYQTFQVLSERDNYKLIIGAYSGNASDSFSSHNNSYFSTYDKKNDDAPACCPCAVSYGSGWWFNSCFECNLNGVYYKKPKQNGYFNGIIWEYWLGNYSLKKSLMMVKPLKKSQSSKKTVLKPYYEDP